MLRFPTSKSWKLDENDQGLPALSSPFQVFL